MIGINLNRHTDIPFCLAININRIGSFGFSFNNWHDVLGYKNHWDLVVGILNIEILVGNCECKFCRNDLRLLI